MHDAPITLSPQTLQYLLSGEIDDSSKAIIAHTQGLPLNDWLQRHHPVHVESIRRCRLLLERAPEVAEKFMTMRDVSSEWAAIVSGWEDLCLAMDTECPNWRRDLWKNGAWQCQGTLAVLKILLKK